MSKEDDSLSQFVIGTVTTKVKITEGMYDVAMGMAGYEKLTPDLIRKMVYEQLRFLSTSGVVLKVEGELPMYIPDQLWTEVGFKVIQKNMLNSGYTKTGRLI